LPVIIVLVAPSLADGILPVVSITSTYNLLETVYVAIYYELYPPVDPYVLVYLSIKVSIKLF